MFFHFLVRISIAAWMKRSERDIALARAVRNERSTARSRQLTSDDSAALMLSGAAPSMGNDVTARWSTTATKTENVVFTQREKNVGVSDRPVALVTGASRGIGKACVLALATAGFDLAFTARTEREGEGRDDSDAGGGATVEGSLERTSAEASALGAQTLPLIADLTPCCTPATTQAIS